MQEGREVQGKSVIRSKMTLYDYFLFPNSLKCLLFVSYFLVTVRTGILKLFTYEAANHTIVVKCLKTILLFVAHPGLIS